MTPAVIYVMPDNSSEDWIVQDDGGCTLGAFRPERPLNWSRSHSRKRRRRIGDPPSDGRTTRQSFANG